MADVNLSIDLISNVSEKLTHRVRKFGFGDGYEQVAVDGVNSRITQYEITTRPLESTNAVVMQTALDKAAVGDFLLIKLKPFNYTDRRYRLANNGYTRSFLKGPSDNAFITTDGSAYVVFQFTLVEAYAG